MTRAFLRTLVLIVGASLPSAAAGAVPTAPVIELRPHEKVLELALVDVDRSGGFELAVASSRPTGPQTAERFVGLYRVRELEDGTSAAEPISEYSVPDDVVAFGVADLLGTGRRSVVYFTAQSVFALDGSGKPKRLIADHRFVFSLSSRDSLPYWDSVVDLDDDGRDDLLLPDPRGYVVYRQRAESDEATRLERVARIDVGSDYAKEPLRRRRRTARDEGPLVMWRSLRQVLGSDLNADRRLDLIAMKRDHLLGYLQQPDGSFAEEPDTRHRLVSEKGRPLAQAAPPAAIAHADVDRDGRTDYVVPELDLSELSTRLRIFMSSPEGLPENPSQIVKLSSLGTQPELVDANGDGHLDLGISVFRSDRLLSLSPNEIRTLDFTYYVFLFDPAQRSFARSPDLRFEASWTVPEGEASAADQESDQEPGFIRFTGDFDADGTHDAALFTADGEFSAHRVVVDASDPRSVRTEGTPSFTAKLPPTGRVRFGDLTGDRRTDVIFVYDDSIRILVTP